MSTSPTERHARGAPAAGAPGLRSLLVVLLGLSGIAAVVVTWAGTRAPARPAPLAEEPAAALPRAELARADAEATRIPAEPAPAGTSARLAELPAVGSGAPRPPRTEREHLERFRALAARSPGCLEALAAAVLDGSGPEAEQVALLRALRATGSAESATWLAHAARKPAAEESTGLGLSGVALALLLADAPSSSAARGALADLVFTAPAPAADLRSRAAAGLARHGDEADLARLATLVAREEDARLVAGVLAALAEREPSPGRTRILLAHGRSEAAPAPAPIE